MRLAKQMIDAQEYLDWAAYWILEAEDMTAATQTTAPGVRTDRMVRDPHAMVGLIRQLAEARRG